MFFRNIGKCTNFAGKTLKETVRNNNKTTRLFLHEPAHVKTGGSLFHKDCRRKNN